MGNRMQSSITKFEESTTKIHKSERDGESGWILRGGSGCAMFFLCRVTTLNLIRFGLDWRENPMPILQFIHDDLDYMNCNYMFSLRPR